MGTRATSTGKRVVLMSTWFLGIIAVLLSNTTAQATTTFKDQDIEVQAWYRMRHTFQTDSKEHFEWVQWRNEAFVWAIWRNFVRKGQLLDTVPIPFVKSAEVNVRYQARVDPVYYLREHYRNLYDERLQSDFFKPQDLFRDLFIDLDHGTVGPGDLSSRWGYQTIVWGEMDTFRSLDVVNPLRIDQSFGVGEKLDELRLPILATKFLYNIGSVGESLSEIGIEGWFSPRNLPSNNHTYLILEDTLRLPVQIKNCLGPDGRARDYSPENCANSRKFLPFRPGWLGQRRIQNPWSIFPQFGPSAINQAGDFVCVDYAQGICQPDLPDERFSLVGNIAKRKGANVHRGINIPLTLAGGVRMLAKTWFGLDFTLNYIFQPAGLWGTADPNNPFKAYGDPDFPGMPAGFAGIPRSGTFEEGLRACLSPDGRSGVGRREQTQQTTLLVGADLRGYDWPERRLDANGAPLPSAKQKQARRLPMTLCAPLGTEYFWNHIIGVTATYNDFDYTGAVFRLEESVTQNDHWHKDLGNPKYTGRFPKVTYEMPVWRHGLGMDLIQAYSSYRGMGWLRDLPGGLGGFSRTQQALVLQWQFIYRPEMSNTNNPGTGAGGLQPRLIPPVREGKPRISYHHWNHIFTVVTAGVYKKYEQRIAVVWEPRAKQNLFYWQVFWHGFWNLPVDLSTGIALFTGSRNDDGFSGLNNFARRDLLWFEATYYLL